MRILARVFSTLAFHDKPARPHLQCRCFLYAFVMQLLFIFQNKSIASKRFWERRIFFFWFLIKTSQADVCDRK
jgi:hypothetical protein